MNADELALYEKAIDALINIAFDKIIDINNKQKLKFHDDLVSLVDKMLDLKQKEAAELSDHQKTVISRKIDVVDNAIDTAVYELYNLTADEIKIVDGKK